MGQWVQNQTWQEIYQLKDVDSKVNRFEELIMEKVDLYFPEKSIRVNENTKPWMNSQSIQLDRRRKREYIKNKRSAKWVKLDNEFQKKSEELKDLYYKNTVQDLKTSNPGQWYSKMKRMSTIDQTKDEKILIQQFKSETNQDQAKIIADQFESISKLYKPLQSENIEIPNIQDSAPYPLFEAHEIYEKINSMKKKSSTVPGDIPWRIISEFSVEFASPLSNIYNTATLTGIWPQLWKYEFVTPVPKVFPTETTEDLRKISGTKNLSKIYESLISEPIIQDMEPKMDPSQFGNVKGLSIQHYLVKMMNQILTILDTNNEHEKYAVLAQLIDWSKAFDRQDPTLGIKAFIKNGVRPTLIPLLVSYFQQRKMIVKWNGTMSTTHDLPGGGPQGCSLGLLEYKSNSNDNADHVQRDKRFKFVDDLSILEKLNLILLGLSEYNFKTHVASDIGIGQKYLPSENFQSQGYLNRIEQWTEDNMMKLNAKKSNVMIFNFTKNFQFTSRLYMENNLLEVVHETKLLGTLISSDLTWHANTEMLTKKAYKRMMMLHKLHSFNVDDEDMLTIYILYIRSILEQSCQVWHFSISQEEKSDLERVQKVACRIILDDRYEDYHSALQLLGLDTLVDRRQKLSLKFAKKCLKHKNTRDMFPLNPSEGQEVRNREIFQVQHAKGSRLFDSSVPQLQRALNQDAMNK